MTDDPYRAPSASLPGESIRSIGKALEVALLAAGLAVPCIAIPAFLAASELLFPVNSGIGPLDYVLLMPWFLLTAAVIAAVVFLAAVFARWPPARQGHQVFVLGALCGLVPSLPWLERWIPVPPAIWIPLVVALLPAALLLRARMGRPRRGRG